MPSLLDSFQTKAPDVPPIVCIYGPSGSRKTQFLIDSGAVLLLTERGLGNRDAQHAAITSYADLNAILKSLFTDEHDIKAIAIDSLDHLAPLIAAHVCQENGKPTLDDFGFGKGQMAEVAEWRVLLDRIEKLRDKRGMAILMTAHSAVRTVQDPTVIEPYDRIEPKLPKAVSALVREKVDILIASLPKMTTTENDKGAQRAVGSGDYQFRMAGIPSVEAKNRYNLPATIPATWASFSEAWKANKKAKNP